MPSPILPAVIGPRKHVQPRPSFRVSAMSRARAYVCSQPSVSLFRKHGALLTSRQVEQLLTADDDSEWANYKGHPINKWEIASLLKPYGIAPAVIHPRGRAADRGYNVRQFENCV